MREETFDAIVIGGGIIGLATAWRLAKSGQRTLLLEQFQVGHTRGSSHGGSRVFSEVHADPKDVKRARRSKQLWRELEREAGEGLLYMTGGIDIGTDVVDRDELEQAASTLRSAHCPFELLDSTTLRRRYPQWRCRANTCALVSPRSGILRADRCLNAAVRAAKMHGALVKERSRAVRIEPDRSDTVIVHMGSGEPHRTKHLVIAAGPWAPNMLKCLGVALPLQVEQVQTVYFTPKNRPELFAPENFPVWAWGGTENAYGFPIFEKRGMKVSFHSDGRKLDNLDDYRRVPSADVTKRLRSFLATHLPDAAGKAFAATTCLYTSAPDGEFVIGTIPGIPHIAYFAGCGGHAFHCAPALGEVLADLVCKGKTSMDVSRFSPKRFLSAHS